MRARAVRVRGVRAPQQARHARFVSLILPLIRRRRFRRFRFSPFADYFILRYAAFVTLPARLFAISSITRGAQMRVQRRACARH